MLMFCWCLRSAKFLARCPGHYTTYYIHHAVAKGDHHILSDIGDTPYTYTVSGVKQEQE